MGLNLKAGGIKEKTWVGFDNSAGIEVILCMFK